MVDEKLIEDLALQGSDFEGGDDGSLTTLSYRLVPRSRTVRLSGLDASVHKGIIRKYFQVLQQNEAIQQPLLVADIKTSREGLPEGHALVTFRTADGMVSELTVFLLH